MHLSKSLPLIFWGKTYAWSSTKCSRRWTDAIHPRREWSLKTSSKEKTEARDRVGTKATFRKTEQKKQDQNPMGTFEEPQTDHPRRLAWWKAHRRCRRARWRHPSWVPRGQVKGLRSKCGATQRPSTSLGRSGRSESWWGKQEAGSPRCRRWLYSSGLCFSIWRFLLTHFKHHFKI